MATEIQDLDFPNEEHKSEPRPGFKYEGSPEIRYMGPSKDEPDSSPYDKSISTAEIKERINQSLQYHRESSSKTASRTAKATVRASPQQRSVRREGTLDSTEDLQGASLTPTKASLYRLNQPVQASSKSPNKKMLSQAIYDEFDMNNSYYQKMLQDAHNTGIRNLSTTSIRSESPFKYDRIPPSKKDFQPAVYRKSPNKSPAKHRSVQSNIPAGPPNASQEILSRVFDGNLSIHSPSKKMQEELERKSLTPSKIDTFVEEKLRTTNTILERFVDLSTTKGNVSRRGAGQVRGQLEEAFEAAIESLSRSESSITPEDQVIKFAGCINNMRKDVKLGGIVGSYVIWRTFSNDVSPEVLDHVLQNVFTQLIHYESQDEIFLVAALELVGFLGPNEISCNSVSVIRAILFAAESGSDLQITAINTLVLLGYPGLQVLVDIANKDYQQLQQVILSRLCAIPFIQKHILVPALLNELNTTDGYKKLTTVAALNRCHALVHEAGGIPLLVSLLEEGSVERIMIASAIRAAGPHGDSTLIKLLKYHPSSRVRVAVASVLKWRRPRFPDYISFVLDENEVISLSKKPLGVMCTYVGPNNPVTGTDENRCEGFVQVNPRDFLAAIQRLLSIKNVYSEEIRLSHPSAPYQFLLNSFSISNVNPSYLPFDPALYPEEDQVDMEQKERISLSVVKGLAGALEDEVVAVRETAASSLGTISLPEGVDATDALLLGTKDPDSNVRAMCAWAIGRLGPNAGTKAIKPLMELLRDNYWKVKTAACIAIGCLGEQAASQTLSLLLKVLKDGSVNKQIVAESIVSMGVAGVQSLIEFMKREHQSNYKAREHIAKALSTASVIDPSVDHVIELLFSMAHDRYPEVRKGCLISLDKLRVQAKDTVTYLKPRHLLPFFYQFLADPDNGVRKCALLCIRNFGAQGELLFIEGLTKDKNALIRKECAYGLGEIGASTFRTLLLALHDSNRAVRNAAGEAMARGMDTDSILDTFKDKVHQKKAIKCAIKEVLGLPYMFSAQTKDLLENLLDQLNKEADLASSIGSTIMHQRMKTEPAAASNEIIMNRLKAVPADVSEIEKKHEDYY